MDYLSSPLVKKIVGEITRNRKRPFSAPNEVCLGDWWLSKPDDGVGVSVSGYPFEMRRCHNTRQCNSASVKKRFAMREFESKQIVKRHGCTRLESSDGLVVHLCGFINRSRTKKNGFSSEVCRDFIFGFPLNWEVSAAQCTVHKPSNSGHESLSEHTLTTAINSCNGAQLHDMVLSLTDTEREAFAKKVSDNLLRTLSPEFINAAGVQPSKSNPSLSPVDSDITTHKFSTMTKAMNSMSGKNVDSSKGCKKRKGVEEKLSVVLSWRRLQRTRNDLYQNDKKPIVERWDFSDQKHMIKHDILTHKCSTMMNSGVGENAGSSERQTSSVRRSRRLQGKRAGNGHDQTGQTPFLERLNISDEKTNIKHGSRLHVELKRLF